MLPSPFLPLSETGANTPTVQHCATNSQTSSVRPLTHTNVNSSVTYKPAPTGFVVVLTAIMAFAWLVSWLVDSGAAWIARWL
jgi:hypothetical protein